MRLITSAGIALPVLLLGSTLAFAAPTMKPGKWEITTTGTSTVNGQMTNMPVNQMEHCVTLDQAKKSDILKQPEEPGCKRKVLLHQNNETKTETTCPTKKTVVDYTMNGDSYTLVNHLEMQQPQMVMDTTMMGKWLGTCTP